MRRALQIKRVGHAGTLDPAAEGVVVVAVGRATRLIDMVQQTRKEYIAHVVLGRRSVSGDIEGPLIESPRSFDPLGADLVAQALRPFHGEIDQIPPTHSAVKIAGRRAYEFAHRGEDVDLPSRRVTIHALEVVRYTYPDLVLRIECSAGTYIRSLARDLGEGLGCGGYLHALLRTRSGQFDLTRAWSLAEIRSSLSLATFSAMAAGPDLALTQSRSIWLDLDGVKPWYDGQPVTGLAAPEGEHDQMASVYRRDGDWLGMAVGSRGGAVWQPRIVVPDPLFGTR